MKGSSNKKRIGLIISIVVLSISALGLVSILYAANRMQGKVAEQQLRRYLDRVELENKIEINNLLVTLNVAKSWINNGLLHGKDFDNLNGKFISLIANTPQVSAISFVKSTGETYSLRYDSTYYESYWAENDSVEKNNVLLVNNSSGKEYYKDTTIKNAVSFLPNFKNHSAIKLDSIVRYPLQLMPGMKSLASVCFSVTTLDTISNENYTLTAYMSVKRLYNFLSALKVTETSEVILFTAGGRVFDFRRLDLMDENSTNIDSYMVLWDEIQGTASYAALNTWKLDRQTDSLDFFNLKYNEADYWAAFKPNRDAKNGIWTGLLVPEADFSYVLKGKLGFVLTVSVVLFLVSFVFIFFAVKILRGNSMLDQLSEIELQDLIKAGENDLVEFKSTVRMNLHSNKVGKEIELAWLKSVVAFCNTEGGRILIGVKDDGEIAGLEIDRFPNDDKTLLHIQNLIKQHIGLEFAKYINYSLREIEGKKILVVRCQSLSRPVFLRFNDKEQFFVRSGPASIELPVSKALEYIRDRDKG